MNHFSQNLLLSSTNSSIQLVQIVHLNSTDRTMEVLSMSKDNLIFSHAKNYDIECKYLFVCIISELISSGFELHIHFTVDYFLVA